MPFIILSFIIPSWFTVFIKEQTQELTVESMDQYSLYINSITTQAQDLGKQVLVNQATQDWLKFEQGDVDTSSKEGLLKKNDLRNLLTSMMVNNSNDMSISVFLYDGTGTWGDNPVLQDVDWFKEFTQNEQRYIKSHIDPYQKFNGNINSYILPLFDLYTFEASGVIKVNFPTYLLETALNKITIGQRGSAYLIDENGNGVLQGDINIPEKVLNQSTDAIANSNNEEGLKEVAYNGEIYYIFYQKLPMADWTLISEVTESDLFSKINDLQRNLLLISGIAFLLTIVASYMLSSNIVSPLGKLTKAMRYIERGKFIEAKHFMPTIKSDNNEIGYVIKVFDHTIDKLKYVIETQFQANILRKDAEYKALLLQINPHFLNNTLEIIGGLAAQGKNKEVMDVTSYLGKMMRYSLNTKSDIVELGEELNYIRNFSDILKIRYEETITINIEEDPKTKSIPIIKFILQPLLENAVKYSFIEKKYAEIHIKTEIVNNQLAIFIKDNGIGMSKEVILDLLNEERNNETNNVLDSKGKSIGLRNVIGRLKLYYSSNFSYHIESEKNKGTKIYFYINLEGRGET
ncbi:sensor histidine kinase [Salipaludibacillus neizhouensis]|uniref:Sensor histidine kinase n=2 Tax=Salipaludibacillus neizhouensis TaxID=885475 RepID=A0A3A9K4N8_9BACI|nr:sensor histidine kinase [Salipaludibacillus neizhouensis]